jgi:hypothetical protein
MDKFDKFQEQMREIARMQDERIAHLERLAAERRQYQESLKNK